MSESSSLPAEAPREIPAEAVRTALDGLRLLPHGLLPGWRVDLDTRVLLCDMDPKTPLFTRLDVLRAWSALLGEAVGFDPAPNRVYAGYLHVRVVRDGADARVRAFITHAEAESIEVLTILHDQESADA